MLNLNIYYSTNRWKHSLWSCCPRWSLWTPVVQVCISSVWWVDFFVLRFCCIPWLYHPLLIRWCFCCVKAGCQEANVNPEKPDLNLNKFRKQFCWSQVSSLQPRGRENQLRSNPYVILLSSEASAVGLQSTDGVSLSVEEYVQLASKAGEQDRSYHGSCWRSQTNQNCRISQPGSHPFPLLTEQSWRIWF